MLSTVKMRIEPDAAQREFIDATLDVHRYVYNGMLTAVKLFFGTNGRLISRQRTSGCEDPYATLDSVYSIWVEPTPKPGLRNTIDIYSMKGKRIAGNGDTPDIDKVNIVFFRTDGEGNDSDGALGMMSVLLSERKTEEKEEILRDKYKIEINQSLIEGLEKLNFGEVWIEDRIYYAKQDAKQEGILKTRASSVISLMNKLGMNLEEAMDAIDVPSEDRESVASEVRRMTE